MSSKEFFEEVKFTLTNHGLAMHGERNFYYETIQYFSHQAVHFEDI